MASSEDDFSSSGSSYRPSDEFSFENDMGADECDRSPEVSPAKEPKGRKNKRNMNNWKREKCKCCRNYGRQYISDKTGQIVRAKILGPGCKCKNKCWSKIHECVEQIFNSFWDMGDFSCQNNYILSNIKMQQVQRRLRLMAVIFWYAEKHFSVCMGFRTIKDVLRTYKNTCVRDTPLLQKTEEEKREPIKENFTRSSSDSSQFHK
ncbi:uncharacterized protein LOC126483997 [Schistocerca serialis cubense]|uniref:uncharacterized protein LOC126483997 n=1 Tax=Schistocerca serialis cubense TaxID=2023355 RepID=UPI00214E09FF|nr:uncharacterized protein LOC126483997 [Schistocerca serialis cubense]